jgi:hypothetical protein
LGLACLRSVDSGSFGRRWGQATITLTKMFFFGAISQLGVQEGALARVVVVFLLLARSDWLISISYACPLGIESLTLSMLRSTKVAGFNLFLCNILLSKTKTKTKTKMGVTSYPKELAAYKWSFLLTRNTRN